MLSQDVVRRLTVVATDTGLTTLKQKLDAVDRAQDSVALSSTRMTRATELAETRIRSITTQVASYGAGALGAGFGRVGGDVLGLVGRLAPAAVAGYSAFKLLNATVEQGVELLKKYGLEGQRALYGDNGDALDKLTRFQGDTTSLANQKYAANLSGRLDEANRQIKEFLRVQLDLTDPALKLMNAWVVIAESAARAANVAGRMSPNIASGGLDAFMRSIPVINAPYIAGRAIYDRMPAGSVPQVSDDEAMRIARSRLGAGMGASGMIGKNSSAGGFQGRWGGLYDAPKEERTAARTAWDRESDSIARHTATIEANAVAVGKGAGEQERLLVSARLTEAAFRSGGTEAVEKYSAEIDRLAERAKRAAQNLAESRLGSDISFDRSQIGLPERDRQINARLRQVYGDDLTSAQAQFYRQQMQITEALRETSDVGRDTFKGFISDLREGKSVTEALQGALSKVSDKLLDMALNNLWGAAFGGMFASSGPFAGPIGQTAVVGPMPGGGGLTSLFAGLFADGGKMGGGRWGVVGERGPELIEAHRGGGVSIYSNSVSRGIISRMPTLPGFADGGFLPAPAQYRPPDVMPGSRGGFGEVLA